MSQYPRALGEEERWMLEAHSQDMLFWVARNRICAVLYEMRSLIK